MDDIAKLPRMYLTEESKTEVVAAGDLGAFVDETSGEVCWPAYQCANPDCPGRSADGTPQLFIFVAPNDGVDEDGEIIQKEYASGDEYLAAIRQANDGLEEAACPACLKTRNLATESPAEADKYRAWVVDYEIPSTAERRAELQQELKRLSGHK